MAQGNHKIFFYLEPFAYTSFLGISEALPFGFAQGREPVERHLDIFKQPP
jgi:hypothetical protein